MPLHPYETRVYATSIRLLAVDIAACANIAASLTTGNLYTLVVHVNLTRRCVRYINSQGAIRVLLRMSGPVSNVPGI